VPLRAARKFARFVLAREGIAPECELSVVFCDEETISALNQQFLNQAGPTDVISFPLDEAPRASMPDEGWAVLGDVVICTDVALAQAKRRGITLEDETLDLLAHGILHLLGCDDASPHARRKMLRRQKELLEEFKRAADA